MSCTKHPVQDDDCTECRLEALDREMDNDLRSVIYARAALSIGFQSIFTLAERQEMARKQGWPEPTE